MPSKSSIRSSVNTSSSRQEFPTRLTAYTDYSLRVLIYSPLQKDRPATISEISNSDGISENHLMKITHNLGKLGYIATMRGRGGMRLAGKPEEINLGQPVRQVEPSS
jgi:Rrf2 family transcriptional regulator, nitric oxide-sensitive transcriptional repressor